jgi:hypothetical protein
MKNFLHFIVGVVIVALIWGFLTNTNQEKSVKRSTKRGVELVDVVRELSEMTGRPVGKKFPNSLQLFLHILNGKEVYDNHKLVKQDRSKQKYCGDVETLIEGILTEENIGQMKNFRKKNHLLSPQLNRHLQICKTIYED